MRYSILIAWLGVSLVGLSQPNCTGIALDVDARCGCVKDPNGQVCALVKTGLYDGHLTVKPPGSGWATGAPATAPTPKTVTPATQPAKPRQARVVPLTHKDYLRFLQPNASLVAGYDFGKISGSPGLVEVLLGEAGGAGANEKLAGALKEMDHLWVSVASPTDVLVLMTGKFEQGAAAGMFYAQGVYPVFLGDAHAMMIGPEPSLQTALVRLAKPAANGGWVATRARELARDHDVWIASEPRPVAGDSSALRSIRRFALGFRLAGEAGADGEAVMGSEADAAKISGWLDQLKAAVRGKAGAEGLDTLAVALDGITLRFSAKGDTLLTGEAGKAAMNSDFGIALYGAIMSGFPGMPARIVAEDKLLAVKAGMKREEILKLLGPPLSVTAIQGLDTPRETWTYQTPFGKQLAVRLDGGVTTGPPR